MNTADEAFPVVIIGGGLAGLTAAAHLADSGIPPLILEANTTWPGGRVCGGEPDTFTYNGKQYAFYPDQGMHALWGGYVNMRETIRRFTQIQLVPSEGETWINRWDRRVRAVEAGSAIRGTWIPAPFHYLQLLLRPRFWKTINPLDFLSIPGFLFSIGWTTGFDPLKEQSRLKGLTMKDYFLGWTPNLRATFKGLGVNLLAAPEESITLTGFIAALRFYTVLRRDAWQMAYFPSPPAYSYIPALIDYAEERGGMLAPGTLVTSLERQDGKWRIRVEDSLRGGRRSLLANHVVLATDAPSAQDILCKSDTTASTAANMQFPGALRNAVVRLWFSTAPDHKHRAGMFTGDFVVDNFFWLHQLYDDFRRWHEETGGSAIEVHIYGSETLMDKDDRHLLILAINDVQMAFPQVRGHFVHGVVRRNQRTQTDFRVPDEHTPHVDTPWPNLHLAGDWVGYDTPSFWMERATTTGIAATNNILTKLSIRPYPIYQPPKPEVTARTLGLVVRGIRLLFAPMIVLLRRVKRFRQTFA